MNKIKSSLKKVLILLVAIASSALGPKAFSATATYEPFFKKNVHYESITLLANDFKEGRVRFTKNITELEFINIQLQNWNHGLASAGVIDTGGEMVQLPTFKTLLEARKYFANLLYNHCLENSDGWDKGKYKVGHIDSKTGEVSSFERGCYVGEVFVELNPNTLPGVNTSDGDYANISGFSLYCGNDLSLKKIVEPKIEPPPRIVYKEKEKKSPVVVPGEIVYKPIAGPYDLPTTTTSTTTSNSGNVTYNITNNSTPASQPAPVVYKNNNGQIIAAAVIGGVVTVFAMWLNHKWQYIPQQSLGFGYSPIPALSTPPPPAIVYNPIEGTAGYQQTYNPIQGNTGGVIGYNPIQGVAGSQPGVIVYDPIQGYGW